MVSLNLTVLQNIVVVFLATIYLGFYDLSEYKILGVDICVFGLDDVSEGSKPLFMSSYSSTATCRVA